MVDEDVRTFAPHASSPSLARAAACAWAKGIGAGADVLASLELVVSELVTNALRHGEGDVTMTLRRSDNSLEVRIHDHGLGLPRTRAAGSRALGGRGLHLVETLSEKWGTTVSDVGRGKTVWAVIGPVGTRP
ncbi:MAG: ATP-binding protein [Marmoricola sp.]